MPSYVLDFADMAADEAPVASPQMDSTPWKAQSRRGPIQGKRTEAPASRSRYNICPHHPGSSAPDEIGKLTVEVSTLYGLLQTLRLVAGQAADQPWFQAVRIPYIHSCQKLLEKIEDKIAKPGSTVSRLAWPLRSSDTRPLLAELERQKSTLSAVLSANGLKGIFEVLGGIADLRNDDRSMQTTLERNLEADTRIAMDAQRSRILDSLSQIVPCNIYEMNLELRHLARQDQFAFDVLERAFRNRASNGDQWTPPPVKELTRLFLEGCNAFSNVIVVIDGVDECGDQASEVAEMLANVREDSKVVKLVLLSRDHQDIRGRLSTFSSMSIAAKSMDIRLYVGAEIEQRIASRRLLLPTMALKEEIREKLINGLMACFVRRLAK
ncbi:hypothetical protein BCR34DRAFT_661235 [Clohesyomyces aquaticus]|uniref:Nephrocystin 3-like N-terminal domain-containing protein n=1 Tax=Clohesyomyces aquaticus TaxID=1231657 RepID=A0A1Y2A3B0_9PLEO|nr:hypothetical protein BCR34DRAFT_661235 [Clohesyomyces aquaticus]